MSDATVKVPPPVYFELSWSILSSIGLINFFYGILVVGITSFSPISAVPIVVSAAGALANGLCYYSFYGDYSRIPTVIAGVLADMFWLIQEAGMSFYSYQILRRVLFRRDRKIFLCCFWTMMGIILAIRITILTSRALDNLHSTSIYQYRIDHLHIGYFTSIAIVESISSIFLLRVFLAAKRSSLVVMSKGNLFQHLVRSTEIRVASLGIVGITRAITYTFQTTAQSAESVANEVDRFAYTLECMFPILLMVDLLGSKMLGGNQHLEELPSYHPSRRATHIGSFNETGDAAVYAGNYSKHSSETRTRAFSGGSGSSQGPIFPFAKAITPPKSFGRDDGTSEEWVDNIAAHGNIVGGVGFEEFRCAGGIKKTVEFELHEYEAKEDKESIDNVSS